MAVSAGAYRINTINVPDGMQASDSAVATANTRENDMTEIQKMKPEIKQIWVDALNSDEYEQGKGALSEVDATGKRIYCCLGVLCEEAVKRGVIESEVHREGDFGICYYDGRAAGPSSRVCDWSGLDRGLSVRIEGDTIALYDLNDFEGYTFKQIADLIEEQY